MPIVKMPDGAQVQFPDDMPAEQIKGIIASKFPEVAKAAQPKQDTFQRASILPFGKDTETGEVSLAVPGALMSAYEGAKAAFTAPGRAMSGELQVMGPDGNVSPEAIAEGLNFASFASPASAATPARLAPARGLTPRPQGLDAAEAATRIGVDLPRAVATESKAAQGLSKQATSLPFVGNPLRDASEKAIGQLDDAARSVQEGIGAGSVARAGSQARDEISKFAKGTLGDAVKSRYDAVDDLVTGNVLTPLQSTARTANDILAARTNQRLPGQSKAVSIVSEALNTPGGMNYDGIKGLRTYVGELLDDPVQLSSSGISGSELKRIYGSLSDDLKNSVARSGGEKATAAFDTANSFAAKVAGEREALQKVLGQKGASDEAIFDRITAMAGTNSRANMQTLLRVKRAVSPETWGEVSSALIAKIGRDPDGNFTPDRFITAYGKLSENAKSALFGAGDSQTRKAIEDIAAVSRRFKQLDQYANTSKTASHLTPLAVGAAFVAEPMTTVASVVGGNLLARYMAKPASAARLAKWAKAYEQAAIKPGPATSALLASQAKVVASDLAVLNGGANAAGQIFNAISRIGHVPAQPENDDPVVQENKQKGPYGQPRMLMPNET